MDLKLEEILKNTCGLLNKHDVEYLVIGGTAVNYYGFQRATIGYVNSPNDYDIDFWYKPTLANYFNLLKSLSEMGVEIHKFDKGAIIPKESFFKIQHEGFKTDFLPVIQGVEKFHESYKNKKQTKLDDVFIPFIGLEDLILNKKTTARDYDLNDIKELKKRSPKISKSPKRKPDRE